MEDHHRNMAMNGSVLTNVPKKIKTQKSDPYAPAISTEMTFEDDLDDLLTNSNMMVQGRM